MTSKRIRATNSMAARRKGKGKMITVTKVNRIPGTTKKGKSTYQVITKKKKR